LYYLFILAANSPANIPLLYKYCAVSFDHCPETWWKSDNCADDGSRDTVLCNRCWMEVKTQNIWRYLLL